MSSVSSAADELAAIIAFLCLSERFRNIQKIVYELMPFLFLYVCEE